MKLHVQKRSTGRPLTTLDVTPATTVDELKQLFCQELHYYPERQRFTTLDGDVLVSGTNLSQYQLGSGGDDVGVVCFKDLGVQISWRLVFVLEYLGPLIITPIFFCCPSLIYGQPSNHTLTQKLGFWLMMIHFIKREIETLFVHRFSHGTMPIIRLPVNCAHYWILCSLLISVYLFHPRYQPPFQSKMIMLALAAAMLFCEWANAQTHVILRNLRPRGSKVRAIPYGWGFDLVSCANYSWECCAWLCFAILTNTLTGWLFLVVAFGQMAQWALKKHATYRKEFKHYPPSRSAIVPMLL